MQHVRNVSLAVALALCTGAAMAADDGPSAGACFSQAFLAADADGVAACYAEGRPAIRDGFAHYFSAMTVKDVRLAEMGHVMGEGGSRTAWGTYEMRMVDKASGAEVVTTGRFTDVSRRIDGRWLYIVDHPSDDPPPAK
jgi:ketosteroid isomerase-like protein